MCINLADYTPRPEKKRVAAKPKHVFPLSEAAVVSPVSADPVALSVLSLGFALLCLLAAPMLRWWFWEYTKPESYYGYAFFVPPLVALMFWHRRTALAHISLKQTPGALLLLVPALVFLIVAVKMEMQAVMSSTFLLSIVAGVWFVCGTRWVKAAAFPLGFLWLMAPLPGPVLNDLTLNVQRLSTVWANSLLALMMQHPHRDGNIIHLDTYTLNVDVPCSGFKLLLTLLTFSAAFAYLTDTTPAKRWALFGLSLPLSVFVNAVRIALIGLVGEALGASAAHTFHDTSGVIGLILCMILLFGAARGLGCKSFAGQPIF